MKVLVLDVGGKGDFLAVVVPLRAGQADGLFEACLAMSAQNCDGRVIAECFLHGLRGMAGLGAMAAFWTGGGNGEFLGHGVSPRAEGSEGRPHSKCSGPARQSQILRPRPGRLPGGPEIYR